MDATMGGVERPAGRFLKRKGEPKAERRTTKAFALYLSSFGRIHVWTISNISKGSQNRTEEGHLADAPANHPLHRGGHCHELGRGGVFGRARYSVHVHFEYVCFVAKGQMPKDEGNGRMTKDEGRYFKFERLTVWKNAREFANHIYRITKKFPQNEQFGITNQLRRAATSVILNIAEGNERQSDQDFQRFLRMAIASLNETVAALYIALDQQLMTRKEFETLREDAGRLSAQLKTFIKALTKH